ncbi:MAG: hypothetical protein E7587_07590 [Ruminococcaceae bacterium]|nr:hypothetical protein [Oscillospiraceae bacterium]
MLEALNITNGDCFTEYFLAHFGGEALPFCEAMMDGETLPDIYSDKFVELRSRELNVTPDEYKSKMYVPLSLSEKKYSELRLWFGKDTFCQMNLLTLLAYLEQIRFDGKVILNYIDDETFELLDDNVTVTLGVYSVLYSEILINKNKPTDYGILVPEAIDLYFDYHSENGALTQLVRNNSSEDETSLICLLLENSKTYGLSDLQAEAIIKKYSRR